MFFTVNKHLVVLLYIGLQSYINAKSVPVIIFKTSNVSIHSDEKMLFKDTLAKTKEMSFCFRLMPRYHRRFSLLKTYQLKLLLRGSENKHVYNLNFEPLHANATSRISRMMPFCGSFKPGKWFSHCFSMKFFQLKQKLTFFLDGEKCFDEIFPLNESQSLYYRNQPRLSEL